MNGMVHGGWPYVWAAYLLSALVLGGYAVHAFALQRIASRLAEHERA